jgi:uncharacterized protein (TIGR03000 family)
VLLGHAALLFADVDADTGYQIGYVIGCILGTLLVPGLMLALVFWFRGVRSTKLAVLWYLGLVMGCALLLVNAARLAMHPEVLEGPAHFVQDVEAPAPAPGPESVPAEAGLENTCRLDLTVPEHAEVVIDGVRTTERGTKRKFVSPPLTPGAPSSYKVSVRYTNAKGQAVDDTRLIPVSANERVHVDFTRPSRGE